MLFDRSDYTGRQLFETFNNHHGHELELAQYALHEDGTPDNVGVECKTCHEVLVSVDYTPDETMLRCVIAWSIEDIHNVRESSGLPKWTDDQAGSLLESISQIIEDRSIEVGWEIIADAMPSSDISEEGNNATAASD